VGVGVRVSRGAVNSDSESLFCGEGVSIDTFCSIIGRLTMTVVDGVTKWSAENVRKNLDRSSDEN
jgi:hypothetical protein